MSRPGFTYHVKGAAVLLALALLPAVALAAPRPGTAVCLSAGSTLLPCAVGTLLFVNDMPEVGWTLTAGGVLLGPAAGYVYGGLPGRGLAVVTVGDVALVGPGVRTNNRRRVVGLVPWRSREGATGLALQARF